MVFTMIVTLTEFSAMEDAHSHVLDYGDDENAAFCAVFDGHGGSKAAKYACEHMSRMVLETPAYQVGNIRKAIHDTVLKVDNQLIEDDPMAYENCGTTAIIIIVKGDRLYCGNVGDSRAIASDCGDLIELSHDHKPSNPQESERIVANGGFVEFNRVNGSLALSRALGDFAFKKNATKPPADQIVSAVPDITVVDVTPDLEFAVLACDGIWDVLKNHEVIDFVRSRIAQKMEPTQICEELLSKCLAPDCRLDATGCDNMTAIIACFLHNGTYDELAKKCQRPKKTRAVAEPPADVDPGLNRNNISNQTADVNSDFGTDSSEGTTSCNDSGNSGRNSGEGAIGAANGENDLSGTGD